VIQTIQSRYFSGLIDVAVDWRVVAFTMAIAMAAGILFSTPLARSASRPELRKALGEGGDRAGGSVRANRVRDLLIVGQVGLATSLLVIAVLLSRSFTELVNVPPGFNADDIITFTVSAPGATYEDASAVERYHRDILDGVTAIAGVARAGMVSDLMFTTENMWATIAVDGRDADPQNPARAEYHIVLPGYFDVLEIPVRAGAIPADRSYEAEVPVLINERMAELYWPGGSALGATFATENSAEAGQTLRISGIVGDVLDDGYDAVAEPSFYLPYGASPWRRMSYLLRFTGNAESVADDIRAAVARVDPDIPAADLRRLDAMLAESVARPRAASLIGLTFALIALLVSASGIYGILSYAVQARAREIGIRAALGATSRQLISMVMGHSTRLVMAGLILGALGSLVAARALSGFLFGVRAWDPISLLSAAVTLGAVGSFAAWIPARRAIGVDPRDALRSS
jgi:predicted permease